MWFIWGGMSRTDYITEVPCEQVPMTFQGAALLTPSSVFSLHLAVEGREFLTKAPLSSGLCDLWWSLGLVKQALNYQP